MNTLMGSLGLDEVESDPNALPDGRWAGEVTASRLVYVRSKNQISHVIEYTVTEGNRKGAKRSEFFPIAKDVQFAEGHEGDPDHVTSHTPVMTEDNKRWYKKRFVDLGIAEGDVSSTPVDALVGKKVTFGTKKKDGYINVSFVELRDEVSSSSNEPIQGLL